MPDGAPPPVDPARDHVRGTGPRTLLLYADYESPATRDAYRLAQAVAGEVPFVLCVRHLPIAQEHGNALAAAVAAEAAHDQGRFWDMHDALLTGQASLGRADLRAKAEALGLDTERFAAEFASDAQLARVTGDVRGALEAGVAAAPALFVDGQPLGRVDVDALRAALRS